MYFSVKTSPTIPPETLAEARKVYNIHHIYLRIGDQWEAIFAQTDLSLLDPAATLSNATVIRLSLATAFQHAEALPDPLAAQATLKRMDWKYALRLPVVHPGLSATALCQFRQNLHAFPRSAQAYTHLLKVLGHFGLYAPSTSQQITTDTVLSAVCTITQNHRLDLELRGAFSVLAAAAPDWLRSVALPHWYEIYKKSAGAGAPLQASQVLAADAHRLIDALNQPLAFDASGLVEIQTLSQLLVEQYQRDGSQLRRLPPCCTTCSCHL